VRGEKREEGREKGEEDCWRIGLLENRIVRE